jgi:hypothetical protein
MYTMQLVCNFTAAHAQLHYWTQRKNNSKERTAGQNVQQGVETNWYEKDDRENLLFLQRTNKFLISSYKEW